MPIATPVMQQFNATPVGPAAVMTPTTVDPNAIATTSSQLSGILNKGGALMQQAATSGNQQAASRGLLNSSMGIQAAQGAVMDRATPIAGQDAAAINQNLQNNAQITNAASQFNTGTTNEFMKFNAQNENAGAQWNAGQRNEAIKQTMDLNSREALAGIEANYKETMQLSSSAESMYNQVMKNITDINASKDIADKGTAINSQLSFLRSGLSMMQNLHSVQGLITF